MIFIFTVLRFQRQQLQSAKRRFASECLLPIGPQGWRRAPGEGKRQPFTYDCV